MPRTVDEAAHAKRREAFLDVAQSLIEGKGYEQMTVQDVLNELGTSKGALYHYFESKQMLLEGIIDRITDAVGTHLARCAADPDLHALDKLQRFFSVGLQIKTDSKRLLLGMLPVWQSDDNAIVRQKMYAGVAARIAPLLVPIVRQGIQEGVFTTRYPDQAGRIIVTLLRELDDTMASLLLDSQTRTSGTDMAFMTRTVAAYADALERVLGAPIGSLVLIDAAELREWCDLPRHETAPGGDHATQGEQRWLGAVL